MVDKYGMGEDPYTYDKTKVLINKFDIKDENILDEAEREFSTLAAANISFQKPPYNFDYFCELHAILFGDLFDWAGIPRTIDISKGSTRFCNVSYIKNEAIKLFSKLESNNYLQDHEFEKLIKCLAEYYCDINVIHPFREGNGRAQRLLFEHIILNCGYDINFATVTKDEWITANIHGYHCDYVPMEIILRKCIFSPKI